MIDRSHSRQSSFRASKPTGAEHEVPEESKSGEETSRLGSACNEDTIGFEICFGVGVQQAIVHTDRFDESVELIRLETFSKSLVKRGGGVIYDLMGDP